MEIIGVICFGILIIKWAFEYSEKEDQKRIHRKWKREAKKKNEAKDKFLELINRLTPEEQEKYKDLFSRFYEKNPRYNYNTDAASFIKELDNIIKEEDWEEDFEDGEISEDWEEKNENYYRNILGLKGKVSIDAIRNAYRKKIKEYHPDKVAMMGDELKEMATQKTKEINEAYDYFKKKYS